MDREMKVYTQMPKIKPSCRNCLYHYKGRCYYATPPLVEPRKVRLQGECLSYMSRIWKLDLCIRKIIGDEGTVFIVPRWLIREKRENKIKNLEEYLISVRMEHIYPEWCLVTFLAGKNRVKTQLRNQSLINWFHAYYDYLWKKESGIKVSPHIIKEEVT